MKRTILKVMTASMISSSILLGSGVTALAVEQPATSTATQTAEGSVVDAGNKDVKATPPKIEVNSDKFLIEQGSTFDLASELGLKVTDPVEGDITDKVTLPTIDTSSLGTVNVTIKATNTAQLEATLPVVVNIISFIETKSIDSLDVAKDIDPTTLVNGKLDNLTVTLGEVDEEKSTIGVTVSDGTNEITKNIALVDAEGKTFATGETPEEVNPSPEPVAENLPKTGTINYHYEIVAYLIAIVCMGYFIMVNKRKLENNE